MDNKIQILMKINRMFSICMFFLKTKYAVDKILKSSLCMEKGIFDHWLKNRQLVKEQKHFSACALIVLSCTFI